MNWLLYAQSAAAIYLVGGALVIDTDSNLLSKFVFKLLPMAIGLPLMFGVIAKVCGWPI